MTREIKEAIKVLKQGGIVIYPTDTAFGIGCRMDDEEAVKKLFSVRKRPNSQAVPLLCDSIGMVISYVTAVPETVEKELMLKYWPGALTIVLPANIEKIPGLVRGGGVTIGMRIPSHEVPLSLISGLGVPLIGTSANFHGEPTPYKFADLNPMLYNLVDYVIPGTTSIGKESTVIDCSQEVWEIKRQGAIHITSY